MNDEPKNQIRELPRIQRRVLGVLMEKAFTTPEQYPLTLKATITGCNQKSNRDPVTSDSEDDVMDALDAMREDLLCAEVFSDGGRAARYRHYMRHKFDFSEGQFAIIAELMLRGRQQLGELRTRASRMVKIDSQEQLRSELKGLQEKGYLQASGPLDRRGVEVDHTFYLAKEQQKFSAAAPSGEVDAADGASEPLAETFVNANQGELEETIAGLRTTIERQAETIRGMESLIAALNDRLERLESELGV